MNGNNVKFADALKTMIFCEGGGEETFLNMLKKVNKYAVSSTTLTFMIDDVAVMRFSKNNYLSIPDDAVIKTKTYLFSPNSHFRLVRIGVTILSYY
jgi:hypothetical protein